LFYTLAGAAGSSERRTDRHNGEMSDGSPTSQPTADPPGRVRIQYPRWLWFVGAGLMAVVLAAIVALFAVGGPQSSTGNQPAIEQLIPRPDSKILQQEPVGIDLEAGWDATLLIQGIPIPDDQIQRIPGLNVVQFQPGPGKAIEQLPPGQNCATAVYWQIEDGPANSENHTWCFTVV
jgi:hypothetical protein